MQWMTGFWQSERERAVALATRWVHRVAGVSAPSGTQRNKHLQTSNNAMDEYVEQRRSLHKLQGAMRRAGSLPTGRSGHMPDFSVAYHSPRDEGRLIPSQPSRHSFVVAVDQEGEETWIVDPLLLQPAQDMAVSFQRARFIVHSTQHPWPQKVAHKQKCSYLAVKAASALVYKPRNDCKIPKPGDPFDKHKSMTEQHREEQRSMLEWLQEWSQIKVQTQSKRWGKYVPKCPQIVSTAEITLQAGLRPCGYTVLSKEAMMAAVARRSGRAPDVMRSVAAGPEPMLMRDAPEMELRYCGTSRAQELLGLAHPSRQWSRSMTRKEEPVAKTWWLVLIVTETETDAVVGMRAPGRPRRQGAKQASKARKGKEEEADEEEEEEEEEEREPAQKRRKC